MEVENVADLYKLSPVQEDILSETLEAQAPDCHWRQAICTLQGQLDYAIFKRAWRQAMRRHAVLRTGLYWEGLEKPIQVVQRRVSLPLEQQDWRSITVDEQQKRLEALIRDDRHLAFDLNCAPLMRLSLVCLSDDLHQLIWNHHCLVLDEPSASLVIREVFESYESLCLGEDSFTQQQSPSFKDYISWLRRQDLSAAESFWRDTLRGFESASTLNGFQEKLRARSRVDWKQQRAQLSDSISFALQSFVKQYHLSVTTLLLGAWALLLTRYNDEDEAVFGVMFSGRPPSLNGVESIAGCFSHTLPAHVRALPTERLLSWLTNFNHWYVDAKRYQHVGLKEIRDWGGVQPGQTLFETVVGEVSAVDTIWPASGANLKIDSLDSLQGNYPLLVTAQERPQISFCISYDGWRFEDPFVSRLLGQLETLLERMVVEPEQRLADISSLTVAERRRLLTERDNTSNSPGRCVHELFQAQAESTPHSTAIIFAGRSLSYLQLNERANKLAHHLQALGVGPEVSVGVCMSRSLETVVALLGILKAGGAYLPLDPRLPPERLSFILEETRVPVLITQQDLLFELPPIAATAEVICMDSEWETIAEQSSGNLAPSSSVAHIAYIIYTSGSTGRPKGVCIPHAAASSHLQSIKEAFALAAADRVLEFASLSFDVSLEQILAPLLSGATVVLRPSEVWSSHEFWEQVVEQRLTVVNLPPAYWNQVTQVLAEQNFETADAPAEALAQDFRQQREQQELQQHQSVIKQASQKLRLMIVGGDVMSPEAVRLWQRSLFKGVRLLNAYGPTETTITATLYDVPKAATEDDWFALRRVPIGHGVGGRRLYVLDRTGQLVTAGGRGELHIGGVELARGYFNDAELTADRFMPDPYTEEAGGRMYRTGDVVRRRPSGELEYEGRRDEQVKVRGYRVELGDVEAALAAESGVKECAAAIKEGEGGEKRLVGYVVIERGAGSKLWELRGRLKERLPEYMIPAAIMELEKLPLTISGKVDRRALPLPDQSRPELEESFVPPNNPIEEKLVKVWGEVLGIKRMGVTDNFFELGGDSLLATQLISRVQKTFQTDVPLRTLFDEPTIAGLARNIETYRSTRRALTPRIEPTLRGETIPLSFAQERLWFMSHLELRSPLFNITTAVRLKGVLDRRALEQTFSEIIRRHEALRTTFQIVEDAPAQIIHPAEPFRLPVTDLNLPERDLREELSRVFQEDARHVFNLKQLPLVRASLLRLEPEEHVLLLTMHHIVSDGWSIGIMVREVAALYAAYSAGEPSPLPELPVQYADFAFWQRQWLKGEVLENLLDYWRRQLGGNLTELKLPTKSARPSVSSAKGETQSWMIGKSLSERLKELSRREGTTIFMTLMAAFQTLLHRYSGQDDIIVGTDIANRNQVEIEGLIGFFVNLLPIRTNVAGNPTFREFLQQVKDVTLEAYAHQDLPFAKLVGELQPERRLNRAPLFQVLFVMQNAPAPVMELTGLQLSQLELDEGVAKFDLAVFMEETEQGLVGKWNYSTELFEASTILRMIEHFEQLLESIVAQPEARLRTLEMLTDAETMQQVAESQNYEEFKINRLRTASRKAVKQVEIVRTGSLPNSDGMPLVMRPAMDDVELIDWAGRNLAFIDAQLLKHGAVLFRDFPVRSVSQFERFASTICPDLFSDYGDLPREEIGGKIYGSTPYPSNQTILFHNESSHLHRWPMKIWFYCVRAANKGGETPIADCRRVYKLLPPEIRNRFAEKGIRYLRNYTEQLDVSWADFFHTTSKKKVEEQCREGRIEWEWSSNNELQTRKVTVALAQHPRTGETVFFNQLQLHHASCLEPTVRESLLNLFGEERLPRNAYYGDGSRIEDDVMAEVGEAYNRAMVSFPWQVGDILMLDNMLVAHGRNPFEGERKIVVALGEMLREEELTNWRLTV
jgi:non-ribosomal peptide synthetase component F/alpha-ketoglutarate-dependent taurine dioxygenase/acyl carrier protein